MTNTTEINAANKANLVTALTDVRAALISGVEFRIAAANLQHALTIADYKTPTGKALDLANYPILVHVLEDSDMEGVADAFVGGSFGTGDTSEDLNYVLHELTVSEGLFDKLAKIHSRCVSVDGIRYAIINPAMDAEYRAVQDKELSRRQDQLATILESSAAKRTYEAGDVVTCHEGYDWTVTQHKGRNVDVIRFNTASKLLSQTIKDWLLTPKAV